MTNEHDCPYVVRGAAGFGRCKLIEGDTMHSLFEHCIDNRYGCLVREENLKRRIEAQKEEIHLLKAELRDLNAALKDYGDSAERGGWQ